MENKKMTLEEKWEIAQGVIFGLIMGGGFIYGVFSLAIWSVNSR